MSNHKHHRRHHHRHRVSQDRLEDHSKKPVKIHMPLEDEEDYLEESHKPPRNSNRGHHNPLCKKPSQYVCNKTDQALFSRSSSTSGTDSSIRVRKRSGTGCTERKWFICASLAMIITVLLASVGIYFGYQFLRSHLPPSEKIFGGQFTVTSGDTIELPYNSENLVPGSISHLEKSRFYQHKLDLIFSGSTLAKKYLHTEVFLVENTRDDRGLKVHFNIHMDATRGKILAEDIATILKSEVETQNEVGYQEESLPSVFGEILIDSETVSIKERATDAPDIKELNAGIFFEKSDSVAQSNKRVCVPFHLNYCENLPYNFTSYPNALGHQQPRDAHLDLKAFKEVIDSKCYNLAYEFACQLLQPVCHQKNIILPCRQFCQDFLENCANILPGSLKEKIQCERLKTESDGPGACISKPGCVSELRNSENEDRVCDGTVDCPDFSDELYCPYCLENHFHCGVGQTCIPKHQMCDGNQDCVNGADEKGCLSLSPQMNLTSYIHQYYNSGYLVYQENGEAGKVCADHMNKTIPPSEVDGVLKKLGRSMCGLLEYKNLKEVKISIDKEKGDVNYVDMIGSTTSDKSFISVPCNSKEVVEISCGQMECGKRPAHINEEELPSNRGPRRALHGDWPWHVALLKNEQHLCDGILIDESWIMTTSSCFLGQNKAKWYARFASVRLGSRAPWEQKRNIIGMVNSPVEGNSIAILKMDEPVSLSDFTRPICLPASDDFMRIAPSCVTLGWDSKAQQLHMIDLKPADKKVCEEESEVPMNSICTVEVQSSPRCLVEEYAGAPLMCEASGEWHLVGISSWRRGCSKTAKRPRIYDKVSLNSEWTYKTIDNMSNLAEKEFRKPTVPKILGQRTPRM